VAYKNAYGITGYLTQPLPASLTATTMQLDASSAAQLKTLLGSADWTFMRLGAGGTAEVVQVFYSASTNFPITRQQDGSLLNAHVSGDPAVFELTALAVAAEVTPVPMTVIGTDLVTATTVGTTVTVDVPEPAFVGSGITITGTWPNLTFTQVADDTSCCGGTGGSGSSGITSIFGAGLVAATQAGSVVTLTVPVPAFTSADNSVTITGHWPTLDFSAAASSAGTVTSVTSGTGITVTGIPSIAPVVNLTATGVTAGTYGGLTVNAQGQLTAVDSAFNPPSIINSGSAAITSARVGNTQTLTATPAAEGVVGVVALADASSPLNPLDHATAVNPALLASVISSLAATSVSGVSTYTAVSTGLYTNIISGAILAVAIPSGQSLLVHAHVTMVNTTTPGTPVQFGMAIFNTAGSGTIIQGDQSITQSQQSMSIIIAGPLTTSLALLTTAVPSGSAVLSYGLVALAPG
jgi:hypothetical protein